MKCFLNSLTIFFSVCILHTSAELTEFQWSRGDVSGIYKNEDGSLGIKFVCRIGYLQVKTLNDITIVEFNSYREVDKRMARSLYILDGEYLQHKSGAHGHLDRPVGNTTMSFNETIYTLFQLEEMSLLEDASRAIGERGVTGRNTPAVLPFYMFALKVTQLLEDMSLQNATINELDEETSSPVYGLPRQKRIFGWLRIRSSNNDCKKYERYKNCKGLCGKKCDCWRWVCGDCCYHRACYDHDDCCERHGYYYWRCLIAPDVFFCDQPFYC